MEPPKILANSNIAIRMIKAAANADEDGGAGLQELAGHATMLFYMTEEGQEGKDAYLDRRPPNFDADGYRRSASGAAEPRALPSAPPAPPVRTLPFNAPRPFKTDAVHGGFSEAYGTCAWTATRF